jgi:glycosyltransferase involved in cell wall biosynthesis
VEAFGQMFQSYAGSPIQLSIVGSGSPTYEALLRKKVETYGIAHVVKFWGWMPYEQMPSILAEHDVLLLPSIWQEPLARMTQEAMACGLVVVGTATGGTPEILHDGENGLIFEPNNLAMLVDKIKLIVNDPALRGRMAQSARETVEQRFTLTRMVNEIESYMSMIVNQKESTVA